MLNALAHSVEGAVGAGYAATQNLHWQWQQEQKRGCLLVNITPYTASMVAAASLPEHHSLHLFFCVS